MKQIMLIAIFSLFVFGSVWAENDNDKPQKKETVVEVFSSGDSTKVIVVEGKRGEMQSKLDSIFEAHGIERFQSPRVKMCKTMFSETNDSAGIDFDIDFDFDFDLQEGLLNLAQYPHHKQVKIMRLNDSVMVENSRELLKEMELIGDEMTKWKIHVANMQWPDDFVFGCDSARKKHFHGNMPMPVAPHPSIPLIQKQENDVIVLRGDENGRHKTIILKGGDDFVAGDEIEVTTKKKRKRTVITIKKK